MQYATSWVLELAYINPLYRTVWWIYVRLIYCNYADTKLVVIAMHMLPCYYTYLHNCLHTTYWSQIVVKFPLFVIVNNPCS